MKRRSLPRLFTTTVFTVTLLCSIPAIAQIQLSYNEQVHNFGHVGIGFAVQHTFRIPNTGKTAVKLTKLEINCECTTGRIIDSLIAPGDTGRIVVNFDTKDYYGPTNKSFKVYTDNPESPMFELYYVSIVGQWYEGLKPVPFSLFFLPGAASKQFEIISAVHDYAEVDSIRIGDTLFTVKSIKPTANKNEKFLFEVSPNPNLGKGTFHGSFTVYIRLDRDEAAEPTILTTPVKIVRF